MHENWPDLGPFLGSLFSPCLETQLAFDRQSSQGKVSDPRSFAIAALKPRGGTLRMALEIAVRCRSQAAPIRARSSSDQTSFEG